MSTIIANCGEIAHLSTGDINKPISGHEMSDKESLVYPKGYAIIIRNGKISLIDDNDIILDEYIPWYEGGDISKNGYNVIDAGGKAIIPGLVDSHNHLVWSGDRSNELYLRQSGNSYLDIAKLGGGIKKTVNSTRKSSFSELLSKAMERLEIAIMYGTTSLEAKSGYGLSNETEEMILKVISSAGTNSKCKVFPTWLGAHDIPEGKSRKKYLEELIHEQLPNVYGNGLAKWVDVFCEPGWFTIDETELIVKASKEIGLNSRLHVDEFVDSGGLSLAAELGSSSGDHVAFSSDESRELATKSGTMQTFLPGTPYILGKEINLPIQKCIDEGWNFSIATDFNPNYPSLSMPFVGSLLSHRLNVNPLVSLIASTRNPATSIFDPGKMRGSLSIGSPADLNIISSSFIDGWCQTPGINPIIKTMIDGNIVNSNKTI
ncbi:MAG: imidazolonepropionase [Euryarchaeota archaeon]|nr:imidazolonepropionase [Euryarchaeota archaeon]|tara:strand:- start:321 stop:1616 length:1296 start_codon:yes stop_codon:yes gene_type:complete